MKKIYKKVLSILPLVSIFSVVSCFGNNDLEAARKHRQEKKAEEEAEKARKRAKRKKEQKLQIKLKNATNSLKDMEILESVKNNLPSKLNDLNENNFLSKIFKVEDLKKAQLYWLKNVTFTNLQIISNDKEGYLTIKVVLNQANQTNSFERKIKMLNSDRYQFKQDENYINSFNLKFFLKMDTNLDFYEWLTIWEPDHETHRLVKDFIPKRKASLLNWFRTYWNYKGGLKELEQLKITKASYSGTKSPDGGWGKEGTEKEREEIEKMIKNGDILIELTVSKGAVKDKVIEILLWGFKPEHKHF